MNHQDFLSNAVGNVCKDWSLKKVDDLIADGTLDKIQDGNHGGDHPTSKDYHNSGVPFLMSGVIRAGKIDWPQVKYISTELASSLRVGHSKQNDVLLTHKGNDLGRVAILEGCDYAVLTPQITYYRILNEKKLNKYFLKYYFESPQFQFQFKRDSQQSTRPFVSISNQKSLVIPIPPIDYQSSIVKLLKPIDDKIQLNNNINDSLETLAKTIFKEWFIDFGPVKAKAEGKKPFGMDEETAALFPDSFIDSEFGQIPKGWEIKSLGEITSYLSRGISPKYVENGGIKVFNQKCVRNGVVLDGPSRLHDAQARAIDGRILEHQDILVNSTGTGTLGRVAQIWSPEKSIVDSHITVIRSNLKMYFGALLGVYCRIRETEIEALGEGSTGQTELSRARLSELKFIVPPIEIQAKANTIIEPLISQKYSSLSETMTLERMRDLLLPKLISGELLLTEVSSD